ncbi:MAG: type II toxin-antitoxin system RelE/ParE family toxin [Oscillospiraceae bacterium]|nr:type II toxin-antitoxin system RelE/ParE family toxin [Oscillospiraceae bacterium]
MNIIYSKKAVKAVNRMDNTTKQRIKAAIEKLPDGDIKQIRGSKVTTYRLRVGGWRVLYSFDKHDTISIEKISPRGEIYKGV